MKVSKKPGPNHLKLGQHWGTRKQGTRKRQRALYLCQAGGEREPAPMDAPPAVMPPAQPLPPLRASPTEAHFRLLCPAAASGGVIGRGGSFVRLLREDTGARVRVEDPLPSAPDDCVVHVIADKFRRSADPEDDPSPAQKSLIRVFERILRVEDERINGEGEEEREIKGVVVCRLLAPGSQVGCILGKGGKIVEKMRQESGAQIRVLAGDQVPPCAAPGDELIHIVGTFSAVKKALLSVSSCLQDNPRVETINFAPTKAFGLTFRGTGPMPPVDPYAPSPRGYLPIHASDHHFKGYSPNPGLENVASGHRKVQEEEVVFRILCTNEKVGSIIGKAGLIVRALQNETGAAIKVLDVVPDSDERVVVISACENAELKMSPAQEAVLRVHSRLTDVGVEKAPVVSARLLVPAQQIGCLLGKGGTIISEMRRATGANIRIFLKEQVPKCAQPNDEVVQVTGSFQSVQDALLHITSRIRESIFLMPPYPTTVTTQYMPVTPEFPPAMLRPRLESTSSGPYSTVSLPHGPDRSIGLSHGADHVGPMGSDRVSFSYGGGTIGPQPTFDHSCSPRSWASQAIASGNPRSILDAGAGLGYRSGAGGSGSQTPVTVSTTIEVVVPCHLLRFIYGENGSNLKEIQEISGAKVTISDSKPGATEGTVVIAGTSNQTRAAQCLLHAFILCGKVSS